MEMLGPEMAESRELQVCYVSTYSKKSWDAHQSRGQTTSSDRSSLDVSQGKFIQIPSVCINVSKLIFKMQIQKKHVWKHT